MCSSAAPAVMPCSSPVKVEAVPEPLPEHRLSIHHEAIHEVEKHKWIASQKVGYDLGMEAVRSWVKKHWSGYLREKWLEHLQGINFWIELDKGDFGLLRREFHDSPFIAQIVQKLKLRGENLSIIVWAHDNEQLWAETHENAVDLILQILEVLDINSARIECQLEQRMCI